MKTGGLIWALIYILFGAYFINISFNFIVIPEMVLTYQKWVMLVGGVLILIGGINHFRISSMKQKARIKSASS